MSGPQNTRFAVATHALALLAGLPDPPHSSEALAASIAANPVHVRRVLGAMREAGLVSSRPGPNGGWQLARPAGSIKLGEVWRAIRDGRGPLDVHQAALACPAGQAIQGQLEQLDHELNAAIEAMLDETTICALAERAVVPATF